MSPASGSINSSLGRSRNAIVFGLSCSTARPAGDVASVMANSCASRRAPALAASAATTTSTVTVFELRILTPLVSPIAPEVAWIDALWRLVFAPIGIAWRLRLIARTGLGGILSRRNLCRRPHRLRRHRHVAPVLVIVGAPVGVLVIAAVVAVVVRRLALVVAAEEAEGIGRHTVIAFAHAVGLLARDQLILRVENLTVAIDPEALGNRPAGSGHRLSGLEVDRFAGELTLGLGRRRGERCSGRHIGPHRLDHRLEDRHRDVAAGRAAAQRTTLAVGVVVADPDRDGDVVGEAHEPGIVLI